MVADVVPLGPVVVEPVVVEPVVAAPDVVVAVVVPVAVPDPVDVLTERDSEADGPVPVAVSVTLWAAPSQGTGMLPVPVAGKPAAAGSG